MATELKPVADLTLTRFWGGENGVGLQLTQREAQVGTFVRVSQKDAVELANALLEFAMNTREEAE